jgi:hypothetical protein
MAVLAHNRARFQAQELYLGSPRAPAMSNGTDVSRFTNLF